MTEMFKKNVISYSIVNFDIFNNKSAWDIEVVTIVPFIPFQYDDDWYVMRIEKYTDLISGNVYYPKFPYLRILIPIKFRGKYKWTLQKETHIPIPIESLPTLVGSSVNSHVHPKERNWFFLENCGFSESDYIKCDWKNWTEYGYINFYTEITFYYRLICDLVNIEVQRLNLNIKSFEEWKSLVNQQIVIDQKFKLTEPMLDELAIFFLRDFLYLWE